MGYCDACNKTQTAATGDDGRQRLVRMFKGGQERELTCKTRVKGGLYRDLGMDVCLPDKDQVLRFLDSDPERAEKLWTQFVTKTQDDRETVRGAQLDVTIEPPIGDTPLELGSPPCSP